jgi:hypothetical protein
MFRPRSRDLLVVSCHQTDRLLEGLLMIPLPDFLSLLVPDIRGMNGRQASMHLAASRVAGLAVCGRLKVLALVGPSIRRLEAGSDGSGRFFDPGELEMRLHRSGARCGGVNSGSGNGYCRRLFIWRTCQRPRRSEASIANSPA